MLRLANDPLSTAAERVSLARPMSDAAFAQFVDPKNRTLRPAVTAWHGADLDAYYLDGSGQWRHCLTGALWPGYPS